MFYSVQPSKEPR